MGNETDLMNELSLGGDIGLEDSPPLVTKTIEPGSSSGHRTKQEPEQYSGPLKKKRPMNSRISLFANPSPDRRGEESDEDDAHDHTFRASEHEDESAQTSAGEHQESKRADAKDRDQRLKETLWELRKMVEVFEGFEQGIRESREGNQVSLASLNQHKGSKVFSCDEPIALGGANTANVVALGFIYSFAESN